MRQINHLPKILNVTLITLFSILTSISAWADSSQTEAGLTIPGSFCECDEADAFPGIAKLFTTAQKLEIKKKFEDPKVDLRRPVSRTGRYKQLNAIGQIVTGDGFGTGILLPGNLVLTNAHVAQNQGEEVIFNVGQTNKKNRWADSIRGKVVAKGSYSSSIPEDWSLIVLDESQVNANEKYGYIEPKRKSNEELKNAGEQGKLMTAGYPGFKDPRYLWLQKDVKVISEANGDSVPSKLYATSSSGASGSAVLFENAFGQFELVGLVQSAGVNIEHVELSYKNGFSFDSQLSRFVNFNDSRFYKNYENVFK